MVNLNSAENVHFMLWPDQFQKIRQIKAWYHRIDLTNPLRSYNGLVLTLILQFPTRLVYITLLLGYLGKVENEQILIPWNSDYRWIIRLIKWGHKMNYFNQEKLKQKNLVDLFGATR